ncbi:MAG: hypothetical protein HW383_841 [Candidatus Magasanikbacteria bacterium]|nr:hypothetical protein [Candidatus Magasanikbacteria bacterium]
MKFVGIVQARMGSTRLPGKSMMLCAGQPLLGRMLVRLQGAMLDELIVATTINSEDDVLVDYVQGLGIKVFRGSVNDVLDRYWRAADEANADAVVRLTGDCPLADHAVINRVVNVFKETGADYACNTQPPTFPDGFDTEVLSKAALTAAHEEAHLPSDREHVTSYIWKNPEKFRLVNVRNEIDWSAIRLTVDQCEDLELVQKIFLEMDKRDHYGGLNEIVEIWQSNPEWQSLNAGIGRNEGYQKSVAKDAV